jgi:hypothetical protein
MFNVRKYVSDLDVVTSSGEFIWFDVSLIKLRLHSRLSRQRIREAYVSVLLRLGLSVGTSRSSDRTAAGPTALNVLVRLCRSVGASRSSDRTAAGPTALTVRPDCTMFLPALLFR